MTDEQKQKLEQLNKERAEKGESALDKLPEESKERNEPEITEDLILSKINEKLGSNYASIEDLKPKPPQKTEEELAKEKEERENRKIAWGIQSGKISKNKIESFAIHSENPETLVFAEFAEAKKEENPELSEEEIKEQFESYKDAVGEKVIKRLGSNIIKNKYPEFFSLENEYSAYESVERENMSFEEKLKTESSNYIKANTEVIDKLVNDGYEVELQGKEGEKPLKIKVSFNKETAEKIKNHLISDAEIRKAVKNGYKTDQIESFVKQALATADFDNVVKQVYQQAMLDKEAALRGIPPREGQERRIMTDSEEEEIIKENLKVVRNVYGKSLATN